jgi:MFS family permease
MTAFSRPALSRFLILYAALYAGFGVQSPYLPSLLESRDLRPEAIALVLAAGSAVRLVAGPAAGRLADRLDSPKVILSVCSTAAALIALGYLPARGLWPLFAVGVFHSAALAPLAPLSDTLALGAAAAARSDDAIGRGFEYGWVRGAGSAAFILGSMLSGQAVGHFGIATVVWLNAALLAAAAFAALLVPQLLPMQTVARATAGVRGVGALLRLPLYRRLVLVAALIMGSHAMHDSFAVIRWAAAGIGPGTAGLLWSLSVAAEVMVFLRRPPLARPSRSGRCRDARCRRRDSALGGNGRDSLAPGACGHRTLARADLRALASELHAASGGMRSTAPCGDGVNALWHRRHRCPSDAADACLGPALRPFRSARVLGDGGSLRRGVAPRSDAARAFWQTNLIFRFSPLAKPAASRCVLICAG